MVLCRQTSSYGQNTTYISVCTAAPVLPLEQPPDILVACKR